MAGKTVNLNEFANEIGALSERHLERLHEATVAGISRSIPHLVANSPVDTGLYASSWQFTRTEWGAIVGNTAPHAPIIEYGARPFTPPITPLLEWAKRVLKDPSQPPHYSSKVWALAKGTQKKISERGMAPKAVMEKSIPIILDNIRKEYEAMS
jgi:hypothetical protein